MFVYLLSFLYVCTCIVGAYAMVHVWSSGNNLGQLVLSSYCVDSGNLTAYQARQQEP